MSGQWTQRVPGDYFRALGALYLLENPQCARERLANELRQALAGQGINYHVRTIKRQLTGRVATVTVPVQDAMSDLLIRTNGLRTSEDIEPALEAAGLSVSSEDRQVEYLSIEEVVPLAQLWQLLNPQRSRRSLASLVSERLGRQGRPLHLEVIQKILAGNQPSARRDVKDELLTLLGEVGISSEEQALEIRVQREAQIGDHRADRQLRSVDRLVDLAVAWKVREREPSTRRLASILRERLVERDQAIGVNQIQAALDGRRKLVRNVLITEMESLVRNGLPDGHDLEDAIAKAASNTVRLMDLCLVEAAPIAALAGAWQAENPGVTQRQLCIRVVKTARRMGYSSSLHSVQQILGGFTHRTRGYVYRAMLKQVPGNRGRIPMEHVLRSGWAEAALTRRPRPKRRSTGGRSGSRPAADTELSVSPGDPLRDYFETLAPHPPPTWEEAIELARRIEEQEQTAQRLLLRTAVGTRELAAIARRIDAGDLRPWNVVLGPRPRDPGARRQAHEDLRHVLCVAARIDARLEVARDRLLSDPEKNAGSILEDLTGLWERMDAAMGSIRLAREHLDRMRDRLSTRVAATMRPGMLDTIAREVGLPLGDIAPHWTRIQEAFGQADLARAELVQRNLRLVVKVAKRYRGPSIEFLDLIQEGSLGLIRAVELYDHRRGYRFSTYAWWWILQYVRRALDNQGRTIRIPSHAIIRIRDIRRAAARHASGCSAPPNGTPGGCEVTPLEARHLLAVDRPTTSLDARVGESGTTLDELLACPSAPRPLDEAIRGELTHQVRVALSRIPPREATVLELRFGIGSGQKKTLGQIGHLLGVSKERVRQIQTCAMERLRVPEIANLLRAWV